LNQGEDRAKYGEALLRHLANALQEKKLSNVHERELRRYRLFYQVSPQLAKAIKPESLSNTGQKSLWHAVVNPSEVNTASQQKGISSPGRIQLPADKLLNRLSFSHIMYRPDLKICEPTAFIFDQSIKRRNEKI
jgi:hypothetical protein